MFDKRTCSVVPIQLDRGLADYWGDVLVFSGSFIFLKEAWALCSQPFSTDGTEAVKIFN